MLATYGTFNSIVSDYFEYQKKIALKKYRIEKWQKEVSRQMG